MWTALALASRSSAARSRTGACAVHAVGRGAPGGRSCVGFPLVYLALPFVFTSLWMVLGWRLRGDRPAEQTLTLTQRRARCSARVPCASVVGAEDDLLSLADARSGARARRSARVCWCTGSGATPASGATLRDTSTRRNSVRSTSLSYGPPLASIEHVRRTAGCADRASAAGDDRRRSWSSCATAWADSSHARVSAPLRRRQRAPGGDHRNAASRQPSSHG